MWYDGDFLLKTPYKKIQTQYHFQKWIQFYLYKDSALARRKKGKNIVLNKFKLGIGLTVLGGLFFFSLSFAESSPVFSFLRDYAAIPFGEIGLYIFFALCFLVGILIMAK